MSSQLQATLATLTLMAVFFAVVDGQDSRLRLRQALAQQDPQRAQLVLITLSGQGEGPLMDRYEAARAEARRDAYDLAVEDCGPSALRVEQAQVSLRVAPGPDALTVAGWMVYHCGSPALAMR